MEKIMNFYSGLKIPAANRHTTSPTFSSPNVSPTRKDIDEDFENLSPIYKKQNIPAEKVKECMKDLKILQINKIKYETDESELTLPEETVAKTTTERKNEEKKHTINTLENDIKAFSSCNSLNKEEDKKKAYRELLTPVNHDPLNKIKEIERTISDAEAERNINVLYKEKENNINNHPFRHLIYSPNVTESIFTRFLILTHRGLVYAKKCLKQPSEKFIKTKQIMLKDLKNVKKKTLFLDLDETLIHTCQLKQNPEHVILLPVENGNKISVGINVRPYCLEFLEEISILYEIYIFTASSLDYATEIINFIDFERKYICGLLVRENCMETKIGFFIKDLRVVQNRALKDMIIVDNLAHSFGFQIDNGIPILEFHDDKNDKELKNLCSYLIEASSYDDLREFNRKKLMLNEFAEMKLEDIKI